jgi:hypothetical protein
MRMRMTGKRRAGGEVREQERRRLSWRDSGRIIGEEQDIKRDREGAIFKVQEEKRERKNMKLYGN